MPGPEPTVVFACAFGAGVLAQVLAHHLRLPSIVLLFAFGIALGPDGAGWIVPASLGEGLYSLVHIAVAIILFEGGLNLSVRRLRREERAIRRLVTLGVVVTACGGTLAARFLMDWPWRLAVLFGTLVVVTGPTVIKPVLRHVRLRLPVATVLEAEGVLNDPIGAILAAVTLQAVLPATVASFASGFAGFVLRLAFGTVAGLVFGFVLGRLLRLRRVIPEELANLVTLGAVLALFEGCELVLSESGILAVTLAGIVVANMETRISDDLREFKENLTVGLIGLLFVLLAADVRLLELEALGWPGVATVAVLAVLVRPVSVFLSTAGSSFTLAERGFLAWLGPRGIVAAAVASLAASDLEALGVPGARELRALVFLTIALTVVVEGGLAPIAARVFRVRAPGRDAVVILGAADLGLALGEVLSTTDKPVIFIDNNPGHVQAAQDHGFTAVYGNVLAERTLAQARLDQAQYALGVTPSDEVNSLFAREAIERYSVPHALAALSGDGGGVTPRALARQGGRMLFDRSKDVERWNVRIRHNQARIVMCRYIAEAAAAEDEAAKPDGRVLAAGSDPFLVMAVQRDGTWVPMHDGMDLRDGDTGAVLIYEHEAEPALEQLRTHGWHVLETGGDGGISGGGPSETA